MRGGLCVAIIRQSSGDTIIGRSPKSHTWLGFGPPFGQMPFAGRPSASARDGPPHPGGRFLILETQLPLPTTHAVLTLLSPASRSLQRGHVLPDTSDDPFIDNRPLFHYLVHEEMFGLAMGRVRLRGVVDLVI